MKHRVNGAAVGVAAVGLAAGAAAYAWSRMTNSQKRAVKRTAEKAMRTAVDSIDGMIRA